MVARCGLTLLLVLVLVPCAAVPVMAQQSRSNPYSKLFKPRDLKEVARSQQAATGRRVECGTTKVPVNPQTDPKVARDSSVSHYTMRVIPPHCR